MAKFISALVDRMLVALALCPSKNMADAEMTYAKIIARLGPM